MSAASAPGELLTGERDEVAEPLGAEAVAHVVHGVADDGVDLGRGRGGLVAHAPILAKQDPAGNPTGRMRRAADRDAARSALDVGQLLGDQPVPEPQHVDAADVPRRAVVVRPGEPPAQHAAVARDERLLLGERRVLGLAEQLHPDRAYVGRTRSRRTPSGAGPVDSKTQSSVISAMIASTSPDPNAAENGGQRRASVSHAGSRPDAASSSLCGSP